MTNLKIKEEFYLIGMLKDRLVVFEIYKDEIEKKDYKRVLKFLKTVESQGKEMKENLMLSFHGYDSDTRELYEIQEVRDYMKGLIVKFPQMPYFMTSLLQNHNIISMLIGENEITHRNNKEVTVQTSIPEEYSVKIFEGVALYAMKLNETDNEIRRILKKYPLDLSRLSQ